MVWIHAKFFPNMPTLYVNGFINYKVDNRFVIYVTENGIIMPNIEIQITITCIK